MSITELREDFKILKANLDEILELLKTITSNENKQIDAVAAKIINELKSTTSECNCNKEILEILEQKDFAVSTAIIKENPKPTGLEKYSYPNYGVGNAELGSSGNPKALTWPFGKNDKKPI